MKVLHISQNFNTSLFTSLFDEINSLGINQTVFYPYINSKGVHSNINDDITELNRLFNDGVMIGYFVLSPAQRRKF